MRERTKKEKMKEISMSVGEKNAKKRKTEK